MDDAILKEYKKIAYEYLNINLEYNTHYEMYRNCSRNSQ
jgi:hypothetical protein